MRFSEEEKARWLEGWRQSGKSAGAYAKEHGLVPWTFTRWAKTKTESKACFVEVPSKAAAFAWGNELLVETKGIRIHIPLSIGSDELRTIIDAVAGGAA
jgi:transposase-like protein